MAYSRLVKHLGYRLFWVWAAAVTGALFLGWLTNPAVGFAALIALVGVGALLER